MYKVLTIAGKSPCLFNTLNIEKRVVVAISYAFKNKLLGLYIPNMDRMRLKINRDTHGVSLDLAPARFGANDGT